MLLKSTKHAQYALILYYILTVFVHKLIYFLNKYENILDYVCSKFQKEIYPNNQLNFFEIFQYI